MIVCMGSMLRNELSVGALAFDVARWIVVADHEHPPVRAFHPRAPEMDRLPPHDLRVVQALAPDARVRAVVVVRPLGRPELHRLLPAHLPVPLGKVLAVRPHRVVHVAVVDPLVRVPLGVRRHGVVPRDRADPDLGPDGVVRVDEVLVGLLPRPWRDAYDGQENSAWNEISTHCSRRRSIRRLLCRNWSVESWILMGYMYI